MLSVEMTLMPGLEQLLDVLPALLVPRARDVRVRELVDERDLRPPREHRVDVHLLEHRAAVVDAAARGTTSRSPICAAVLRRPCVSTKPTTTSSPYSRRRRPSFEHRERLADAGRGAEVDAERALAPCRKACR